VRAGSNRIHPDGLKDAATGQKDIAELLGSVVQFRVAQTERAIMNAYLFSAGCTTTQLCPMPDRGGRMVDQLRTSDNCASAIIYGGEVEQAQKRFGDWLRYTPDAAHSVQVDIKRLVAAQFVDQLLTESGGQPLDWPRINEHMTALVQNTAVDDFEQGYWVDINQTLPLGNISADIESLKSDLPEDIRSGLNWSPDKQFYFLVSVLSRPLPPPGYSYGMESDEINRDPPSDDDATETESPALDGNVAALPELMDKEAAALVQARNSVVAAWLWRKYAADTRLARNDICIAPCCSLIPVE